MHKAGERGVTLLDTVVGTALMLVIFMGIAAAFQLSLDVVSTNKARSGAIALADERMEYVRSLPYTSVGTVGGIPPGSLAQSETISLNNTVYTRRTLITYVDDPEDGFGVSASNSVIADYKVAIVDYVRRTFIAYAHEFGHGSGVLDSTGVADYKAVRVDVAWSSRFGTRHIVLVSRLEPATGLESSVSGGTLTINVVNAVSQPLAGASVAVTNANTSPAININTFTNTSGVASFIGAPAASGYQVVVGESGYSGAQTYSATSQNTNPNPGNLTVSNNQTTTGTFVIDLLSSMTVKTYSLTTETWQDVFNDESKVDMGNSSNVEIAGNQLRLAGNQPFTQPGEARSVSISPTSLSRWGTFSWSDTRPSETTIVYRIYYPTGVSFALVPDSVLPGNSSGFTGASVDVKVIPAATYPALILDAVLTALNPNAPAPSIQDWSLTYDGGVSVNVTFSMHGAKTIGSGPSGTLYKYDNSSISSGASGSVTIPNLEWDTYTMSILAATGYDIESSCTPQPIYLAPNSTFTARLFFAPHTTNSLLVDVKNASGALLSGATVHLTKGGSYDKTIIADVCGQSFFSDLTNGTYSLTVSNPGNQIYSTNANVTGTSRLSVILN